MAKWRSRRDSNPPAGTQQPEARRGLAVMSLGSEEGGSRWGPDGPARSRTAWQRRGKRSRPPDTGATPGHMTHAPGFGLPTTPTCEHCSPLPRDRAPTRGCWMRRGYATAAESMAPYGKADATAEPSDARRRLRHLRENSEGAGGHLRNAAPQSGCVFSRSRPHYCRSRQRGTIVTTRASTHFTALSLQAQQAESPQRRRSHLRLLGQIELLPRFNQTHS